MCCQVNGHEVVNTDPPHVALYEQASLLEHSCLPTCGKTFSSKGDIIIYATADITKGTHLSISYTDLLWGTINRRHHLAESKLFLCKCPRCKDPTELGTFFSAFACRKRECPGSVLPNTFCNESNENLLWECDHCGDVVFAKDAAMLLENIGHEIMSLGEQNILESEKFLKKWESFIHENHHYLVEVRLGLALRYGDDTIEGIKKISDSELEHKIKLCKQLLALFKKLVPGEFRVFGMLYFHLQLSINEIGRRKLESGELNDQAIQSILLESKSFLENCIFYFQHEPENQAEGRMKEQAKHSLLEITNILKNSDSALVSSLF
uniref:SET domain-containing protein n=1 Tax=Clastoptera arizonana TaxID=38151 RepID=A0A1B6C8V2_9HEMI